MNRKMNHIFSIIAAVNCAIDFITVMANYQAGMPFMPCFILLLSLLSISVIFYILGAPFIAALEVIVYAGAIMVLFIFVAMMLNIGLEEETEKKWLTPRMWILPSVLAAILLVILIYVT